MEPQITEPTNTNPAPQDPGAMSAGSEPQGQEPSGQQPTETNTTEPGALDYSNPEATKTVVEQLRAENAKLRTKSKERDSEFNALNDRFSNFENGLKKLFGGEEDNLTPEQQVEALTARNEQLEMSAALKEAAFEYEIPRQNMEYFEFLVQKELSSLEEGEELTDEDLDQIAQKARMAGQSGPSNTSVDGDPAGEPTPGTDGGISLEEFADMGIMARSQLYSKDPKTYEKLVMQEKAAKKQR